MIIKSTFNNITLFIIVALFTLMMHINSNAKCYEFNPIYGLILFICLSCLLGLRPPKQKYNRRRDDNIKHEITHIRKLADIIINEDKLKTRKLKIYDILAITSKSFLHSNDPNDGKVEQLLCGIVNAFNFNNGFMYKIVKETNTLIRTYEEPHNDICVHKTFTYKSAATLLNTLKNRKHVIGLNNINSDEIRSVFKHIKFKTIILIPIHVDGRFTGFMGFAGERDKIWKDEEVKILNVVSEIFASWCSKRKLIEMLNKEC